VKEGKGGEGISKRTLKKKHELRWNAENGMQTYSKSSGHNLGNGKRRDLVPPYYCTKIWERSF